MDGFTLNPVAAILAAIRASLAKADKEAGNWEQRAAEGDEQELVEYFVERAFIQTMVFLEAAGLPHALEAVTHLNDQAKKKYAAVAGYSEGLYLVWAAKLQSYLEAIETAFVGEKPGTVTKELIDILRATQYSITDRNCFQHAPAGEEDVHARIEAVLRCVFPDLRHKPPIAKPIKNFEPDTGLPSLRTLIEYKYVATKDDVKRVVGEVLADTRGYVSKEWERFVYVIYETLRLKPESEWMHMLQESGVGDNTRVVVISGERPEKRRRLRPPTRSREISARK
jgi:hypothetical protein